MHFKSEIYLPRLHASMRCRILLVLISLLLVGCSFVPNELNTAEQLADNHSDSCLQILQNLNPTVYKAPANRALYGLLLFQALEANNKPMLPDSLIDFSIDYYLSKKDNQHLAKCYFYKARRCKSAQRFEEAGSIYLNVLDLLPQKKENFFLLGRVYSDMGDISMLQMDYSNSLLKFRKSITYFNRAGAKAAACYKIISIGGLIRNQGNSRKAFKYYNYALSKSSDSLVTGYAFQEIGVNYYCLKQYDSARVYLRRSLRYPYKGTNYCIRCVMLADLMFNVEQVDSAAKYAMLALKYPATFYNRRDCYRILANSAYNKPDFLQMKKYIGRYQDYSDSVHRIESQTKIAVLENLHNTKQDASGTKRSMLWIVSIMLVALLTTTIVVYLLYRRNKLKMSQMDIFRQELNTKREFASQSLSNRIQETRELQADKRRNATPELRALLDQELYERCLHLSNWDAFSCEMNHAFNQLIDRLQNDYPTITQKEIIWCCLHLLNIPPADRLLILDATTAGMYKLKQRLARKMILKSTKELDQFLKELVNKER
jgi:tetratricopeptide (TPR) repeat protein